LVCPIFFLIFF